ncbi:MAG: hypothetical protein AAF585_12180 [Verrucomicrobiota bacterium]
MDNPFEPPQSATTVPQQLSAPEIPDKVEKAIRHAAIVGFVVAGLGILLLIFVLTTGVSDFLPVPIDIYSLFDFGIFIVCAIFVLRRSRCAAVFLLLFYIFNVVATHVMSGELKPASLVLPVIIAILLARGVWGTFAYHKIRKQADPNYRAAPKWATWIALPAGVVFVLCLGCIGGVTFFGVPAEVIAGEDLNPKYVRELKDNGIVEEDETIELFYSAGMFSVVDEGNILTDWRAISYGNYEGEAFHASASYDEVSDLAMKKGDFFTDSIITVSCDDGSTFELWITVSMDGDDLFLETLKSRTGN